MHAVKLRELLGLPTMENKLYFVGYERIMEDMSFRIVVIKENSYKVWPETHLKYLSVYAIDELDAYIKALDILEQRL